MREKLEQPQRIAELNPLDTLRRIGLHQGDVFCDVGAGSGIFTFAASVLTKNTIYAVDISDDMLTILREESQKRNTANVVPTKNIRNVPSASCQLALLCTVLHEISDRQNMFNELKRILTPNSQLAIIEFHKRPTPIGPPQAIRLDSVELSETLRGQGLHLVNQFTLGENMYCLVFRLG
jgi:ubiquinone/menaquinone biosynthesis C-methylase UbiE